jgi:hypothetical protein
LNPDVLLVLFVFHSYLQLTDAIESNCLVCLLSLFVVSLTISAELLDETSYVHMCDAHLHADADRVDVAADNDTTNNTKHIVCCDAIITCDNKPADNNIVVIVGEHIDRVVICKQHDANCQQL